MYFQRVLNQEERDLDEAKSHIETTLNNDEVSSDAELVEFFLGTTSLKEETLKNIIKNERPIFFVNFLHEIDWHLYGL